jgi:hypothetical protein
MARPLKNHRSTSEFGLKQVIFHLHKANPIWVESVPVHEIFHGKTVWQGDVEVFDLTGHPKAKRCYGWSYDEPEQFITILELPPVTDAQSAVKVGVSYQIKKLRKK